MFTLAIAINKHTQVQINAESKTEILEINAWSQRKSPSFKHRVLDTGKKINT